MQAEPWEFQSQLPHPFTPPTWAMAPTAKEQYERLYNQLQRQQKGVGEGSTSRVSEHQLEQLSKLREEWAAELGLAASGVPMDHVQTLMDEVRAREAAVRKREEEVKRREVDYEQQEVVLESLREEVQMFRDRDATAKGSVSKK